jgi:hypothetical protein
MKHLFKIITLAGLLVLACTPGRAEEGGGGHYVPGGAATLIDLLPTEPGFILQPIYLHYKGNAEASKTFPLAGRITANLEAEANSVTLGALYTFDPTVLGARYTVGVYAPYIWQEVTATLSSALGSIRRQDKVDGFGDITFLPVGLAWKKGDWQFGGRLPVYAPTGSYEVGRLANPGLNYWTFDPTVSLSYASEKSGFNAALFAGMTYNTENNDTHYQSGSVLHVEASVQQLLPLGPGFIGLGAEAFLYEQVTADSGSGAVLGDFKGRALGIGPVIDYLLPFRNRSLLVVEFRWLPELDTNNRLEGDYFWLKMAYKF